MADDGLFDVRKVIEKSTSKVSLRELEKRGFRKVKVLKSNDINRLIRQAVETVLSQRSALTDAEKEEYIQKSRDEFDRLMSQNKMQLQLQSQYEEKFLRLETKINEYEQMLTEKERVNREVCSRYEQRIQELVDRLHERGHGAVDRAELENLQRKVQEYQGQARELGETRSRLQAATGRIKELEDSSRSAAENSTQVSELRTHAQRLNEEVMALKSERRVLSSVEIPRMQERIDELTAEGRELKSKKRELEQRVAELEAQLRSVGDVGQVKAELEQKKHELARSNAMVELLEKRLEQTHAELNELRGKAIEAPQLVEMQSTIQALQDKEERTADRFEQLFSRLSTEIARRVESETTTTTSAEAIQASIDKMAEKITSSLNRRMVDDTGQVVDAERMAEVSLAALFMDEDGGVQETNIKNLDVKEKVEKGGVKGALAKLKSMRKGESQ